MYNDDNRMESPATASSAGQSGSASESAQLKASQNFNHNPTNPPGQVTTKSGLVIRLEGAPSASDKVSSADSKPYSIGSPPMTPILPAIGRGKPHRVNSSSNGLNVHSSPVFRLLHPADDSESKRGGSSPSLPPIGLPPTRVDTDEDLMHKAVLWEIEPKELEWQGSAKLGAGAYGEVVRAKWRGTPVAVKKVTSLSGATAAATRELRHEIAVMSHMHHPRVVQFLGACTRQHPWFIIFEYLPGGALSTLLEKRIGRPLPHAVAGRFALDTAQGLRYLHEHKPQPVVHRDLKPSNLVVDASGHLKITDFGLAKVVDMLKVMGDDTYVMTGETGSYRYMSPEVYKHEKYTEKVDIYALGMLMYYMWHGEPPFAFMNPMEAVRCASLEHLRPQIRANLDIRLHKLITACWHANPSLRPSAQEVCQTLEQMFPNDSLGIDPVAAAESCCSVM